MDSSTRYKTTSLEHHCTMNLSLLEAVNLDMKVNYPDILKVLPVFYNTSFIIGSKLYLNLNG